MKPDKVAVVILNFNTRDLLRKLLPSVLATEYGNVEVVVADNASTDGSVELLKDEFPTVTRIELEENYGFAGGYNKALEQVEAPFYVLLNSDVEVDQNWLTPMMECMTANASIAAIQPKILDYNNRAYFEYAGASGGFIDKHAYPFCRGRISNVLEEDQGQYNESIPVFWATGAAMLIRAEDYHKAGGLDADFFAHMEEIDLCWRLQNMGREVWVCPDAKVYHMGGGTLASSSPRKTYLNFRNNLALITKNLPFGQWLRIFTMRLILDGVAGIRFLLSGEIKQTLAIVKAHWSFFLRLPHWWKKRKQSEQRDFRSLHGMKNWSFVYQHFIKGVKYFSEINA